MLSSLKNIFTLSFFVNLGIVTLIVSLLVVFIESKIRQQNHKISSMLSLVSSLADEIHNVRNTIDLKIMKESNVLPINKLIDVSDCEDDDDNCVVNIELDSDSYDDNSDSDDADGDDSDDDSDDPDADDDADDDDDDDDDVDDDDADDADDEAECLDIIEIGEKNNNIRVLNMGGVRDLEDKNDNYSDDEFENNELEELEELEESEESEQILDPSGGDLEPLQNYHEDEIINTDNDKNSNIYDLKSINISNLEEMKLDETNYKKLSINRLRMIVVEKKIVDESSKLKKHELLKLLEIE